MRLYVHSALSQISGQPRARPGPRRRRPQGSDDLRPRPRDHWRSDKTLNVETNEEMINLIHRNLG